MSQNQDLFEKALDCLNRQDAAAFRALQAPDVEYLNPEGVYHGREAAAASFERQWKAFPDGRHEIVRVLDTGTGIAAECRWTGTHTATLVTPMGDVPPTGRKIESDYAIWVDVEAGLAKRIRVYFDQMDYAIQLGLMPAPQSA